MAPTENVRSGLPRTLLNHDRLRPLEAPGEVYAKILRQLKARNLRLGDDRGGLPRERELAAMLTVGKFFAHAIALAKAARNAATLAATALNSLANKPQPWAKDAVVATQKAMEAFRTNATYATFLGNFQRALGLAHEPPPMEQRILDLHARLGGGAPVSRDQLRAAAREISSLALHLVGPTNSIFVDIPGVITFDFGGERDMRRDDVARWLSWEVTEYLYGTLGTTRGVADSASAIIAEVFPELADDDQTIDVRSQRQRAMKAFFGDAKPPLEVLRAIGLRRHASLADQLDALARHAGAAGAGG